MHPEAKRPPSSLQISSPLAPSSLPQLSPSSPYGQMPFRTQLDGIRSIFIIHTGLSFSSYVKSDSKSHTRPASAGVWDRPEAVTRVVPACGLQYFSPMRHREHNADKRLYKIHVRYKREQIKAYRAEGMMENLPIFTKELRKKKIKGTKRHD